MDRLFCARFGARYCDGADDCVRVPVGQARKHTPERIALSHSLDTVIHKETITRMLALLNGHQLLVLYLVLYCSDNYCHAADQLGCRKQTICKHVYNIRALWLEHIPELAEAAAGREAQKHGKRS